MPAGAEKNLMGTYGTEFRIPDMHLHNCELNDNQS